jgi:hypothetical protein
MTWTWAIWQDHGHGHVDIHSHGHDGQLGMTTDGHVGIHGHGHDGQVGTTSMDMGMMAQLSMTMDMWTSMVMGMMGNWA